MDILSQSLNFCSNKYDAAILGYVFMPNHIHLVIHFINGSERLEALLYQQYGQKYKVWQDRFDELYLASKTLLEVKLDYIHHNPLQSHWNLAKRPSNYLYSSACDVL